MDVDRAKAEYDQYVKEQKVKLHSVCPTCGTCPTCGRQSTSPWAQPYKWQPGVMY